jgi:hypothetical protein
MIVLIDIGTHKAEELRVLSGDRTYLAVNYLYWWFDWLKRQIKKIIKHKGRVEYGEGAYIGSPASSSLSYHGQCIRQVLFPRKHLKGMLIISIDPLLRITEKFVSKLERSLALHFLPLAVLPHNKDADFEILEFYEAKKTLSSTLLNPNQENVKKTFVVGCSFKLLVNDLVDRGVFCKDDRLVIRMNCEGSEMAVLKDLIEIDFIPEKVFGSIGDIGKNYGDDKKKEAIELMENADIQFIYFKGSDPSTWGESFREFFELQQNNQHNSC